MTALIHSSNMDKPLSPNPNLKWANMAETRYLPISKKGAWKRKALQDNMIIDLSFDSWIRGMGIIK